MVVYTPLLRLPTVLGRAQEGPALVVLPHQQHLFPPHPPTKPQPPAIRISSCHSLDLPVPPPTKPSYPRPVPTRTRRGRLRHGSWRLPFQLSQHSVFQRYGAWAATAPPAGPSGRLRRRESRGRAAGGRRRAGRVPNKQSRLGSRRVLDTNRQGSLNGGLACPLRKVHPPDCNGMQLTRSGDDRRQLAFPSPFGPLWMARTRMWGP